MQAMYMEEGDFEDVVKVILKACRKEQVCQFVKNRNEDLKGDDLNIFFNFGECENQVTGRGTYLFSPEK